MTTVNPPEIDRLLERYRGHRVPALNELVAEAIIWTIYRGYTQTRDIPMAIFWPIGDPLERSSWEPLAGINDESLHGPFCKACRRYKAGDGRCPLKQRCTNSDVEHAWEAAKRREPIVYICFNGLIDIVVPIVVEGTVIAVLFTGQLRPKPGPIWDTTRMEEAGETAFNVDLWKACRDRIQIRQELVGNHADLQTLVMDHLEVDPDSLEEYKNRLSDACDILFELASTKARLEKQQITSYFRGQLFEAPLDRDEIWNFLRDWIQRWNPAEESFVLGLVLEAGGSHVEVTLNIGLPDLSLGKYDIDSRGPWKQLRGIDANQSGKRAYNLSRLLKGHKLPQSRAMVVPLSTHGFLVYGIHDLADGPPVWQEDRDSAAQFGRDIGLLIDDIEIAHAKEEFLTDFSHELRSPINSSKFTLDRLRARRFSDDPVRFDRACRRLQAQLNRLLMLIEGVWHFQKILSDQASYQPRRINVYEFLARCASQARDMSTREDLEIVVDKPSVTGLVAVEVDRQAFELVVFNLLDNAVKYSTGGTEIRIFGRRESIYVVLTFTNVGIGVPSPSQMDIFDRFTRTDEATDLAPTSAGIGLFLVKNIVEGHGGTVTVESEPHGGRDHLVKFEVRVPMRQ